MNTDDASLVPTAFMQKRPPAEVYYAYSTRDDITQPIEAFAPLSGVLGAQARGRMIDAGCATQ